MDFDRNYKHTSIALALIAVLALFTSAAHAVVDTPVKEALNLVDSGQAQQAFALLDPLELQRAGDADFDTVLGIAANETGQYTRAVFALERALLVDPGNGRARVELGRALFALGDHSGARAALEQTKLQGVPMQAAKTIDDYLQAINRSEASNQASVQWYVEAGLGRDTNANSAPSSPDVAVPLFGGLVFSLNPSAVQKPASYTTLAAGVTGRVPLAPRWSMIASATLQQRYNSGDADVFDNQQIDASLGGAYRLDKHELSLALQLGESELDNERARSQHGVVAEWTYRPDGFSQWGTYLQHGRISYPSSPVRDADRSVVGSNFAQLSRTGWLAYAGGYVGTERKRSVLPGTDHLGHRLWGLRAGLQKTLNEQVAVFSNFSLEQRHFNADDPIFLTSRQDKQINLSLGLYWSPAVQWRVTPALSYTRAKSNIVINDYRKTSFSVTARRDF
jgi:outer membrane protein